MPLPRQARGRELDVFVSYETAEPTQRSTTEQIEPATSRLPQLLRCLLWVCVIILSLILFGDFLARFIREAPFAWPSINGGF